MRYLTAEAVSNHRACALPDSRGRELHFHLEVLLCVHGSEEEQKDGLEAADGEQEGDEES